MSSITVTKQTATTGWEAVKLTECTAAQQFTRLCDMIGRALGAPALDQKVRMFVTKVQTAYNKQLDSRARARVWEAGRIVVRKDYAAKKFSPFTWLLPRSRAFNAGTSPDAPEQDKPTKETKVMAKEKSTVKKIVKHDITLPKEGTTCRKVFDLADRFDGERAKVLAECAKKGINAATATTQFGKWRQFNGLKGRTAKPKAAKKKFTPPAPRKKATPPAPPVAG